MLYEPVALGELLSDLCISLIVPDATGKRKRR